MIEISLTTTSSLSLGTTRGRILLVEKDNEDGHLTRMILGKEGFQVVSVTDCKTAKNVFNESFDLILANIDASTYTEISSIQEIRERNDHVGCIALTSYGDRELPFDIPLLIKPFSSKKLIDDVENIFYSKSGYNDKHD